MTLIDKAEALRRIVLTGEQMAGASSSDVVDAIHRDVAAIPARGLPSVDELSSIIRMVDGQNSLGAGALAEAILAALKGAGNE